MQRGFLPPSGRGAVDLALVGRDVAPESRALTIPDSTFKGLVLSNPANAFSTTTNIATTATIRPLLRQRVNRFLLWMGNVSAGNIDFGVYLGDGPLGAPQTLMWSYGGGQACPAASSFGLLLMPELVLEPGLLYYSALASDSATATFVYSNFVEGEAFLTPTRYDMASGYPLPKIFVPTNSYVQFSFMHGVGRAAA